MVLLLAFIIVFIFIFAIFYWRNFFIFLVLKFLKI